MMIYLIDFKTDLSKFLSNTNEDLQTVKNLEGYILENEPGKVRANPVSNIEAFIKYLETHGFHQGQINTIRSRVNYFQDDLQSSLHLTLKSIVQIHMNLIDLSSQQAFKNLFHTLELEQCSQGFSENLNRMLQFGQGFEASFQTLKYTTFEAIALEYTQKNLNSGNEYEIHENTSILLTLNDTYHLNVPRPQLTGYLRDFTPDRKEDIQYFFSSKIKEEDFLQNFLEKFYLDCQKSLLGNKFVEERGVSEFKFDQYFGPQLILETSEDSQSLIFKFEGESQKIILESDVPQTKNSNSSSSHEEKMISFKFVELNLNLDLSENQQNYFKDLTHSLIFKLQLQFYNESVILSNPTASIIKLTKNIDFLHELMEDKIPILNPNFNKSDKIESSDLARLIAPYELYKLSELGVRSSIQLLVDYRLLKSKILIGLPAQELEEDVTILVHVAKRLKNNPDSIDLTDTKLLQVFEKRGLVDVYMNIFIQKLLFSLHDLSDLAKIPTLLLEQLSKNIESLDSEQYPKIHTTVLAHFTAESFQFLMLYNRIAHHNLQPVFKQALKNNLFTKKFIENYVELLQEGVYDKIILEFLIDNSPSEGQSALNILFFTILKAKYSVNFLQSIQSSSHPPLYECQFNQNKFDESNFNRALTQHHQDLREILSTRDFYRENPFLIEVFTLTDLIAMQELFFKVLEEQDLEKLQTFLFLEQRSKTDSLSQLHTTFYHLTAPKNLHTLRTVKLLSIIDSLTNPKFMEALADTFTSQALAYYGIGHLYRNYTGYKEEFNTWKNGRENAFDMSDEFPFLKTKNNTFISIFFYKLFKNQINISKSKSFYDPNPLIWIGQKIQLNNHREQEMLSLEERKYLNIILSSEYIEEYLKSFCTEAQDRPSYQSQHSQCLDYALSPTYLIKLLKAIHLSDYFHDFLHTLKDKKNPIFFSLIKMYITSDTSLNKNHPEFFPPSCSKAMRNFIKNSDFTFEDFIKCAKNLDLFIFKYDRDKGKRWIIMKNNIENRVEFLLKKLRFSKESVQSLLNELLVVDLNKAPILLESLRTLLGTQNFLSKVNSELFNTYIEKRDLHQLYNDNLTAPQSILYLTDSNHIKHLATKKFEQTDLKIFQQILNFDNLEPPCLELIKSFFDFLLQLNRLNIYERYFNSVREKLDFQTEQLILEKRRYHLFMNLEYCHEIPKSSSFQYFFSFAGSEAEIEKLFIKIVRYSMNKDILWLFENFESLVHLDSLDNISRFGLFHSFLFNQNFYSPKEMLTFLKEKNLLISEHETITFNCVTNKEITDKFKIELKNLISEERDKAKKQKLFDINRPSKKILDNFMRHNLDQDDSSLTVAVIKSLNEEKFKKVFNVYGTKETLLYKSILKNKKDVTLGILERGVTAEYINATHKNKSTCLEILIEKYYESTLTLSSNNLNPEEYRYLINKCLEQGACPQKLHVPSRYKRFYDSNKKKIYDDLHLALRSQKAYKSLGYRLEDSFDRFKQIRTKFVEVVQESYSSQEASSSQDSSSSQESTFSQNSDASSDIQAFEYWQKKNKKTFLSLRFNSSKRKSSKKNPSQH